MKKLDTFKRFASFVLALALILVAIPTMEAKAATDVTVHFKNTQEWSQVYTYTWGTDGELFGTWPGTDVTATADAEGYYTATLTGYAQDSLNIIFSDGNGTQTVDLLCDITQSAEWWVVPTDNGSGKWACTVAATKADAEGGKSTEVIPSGPAIPENPTVEKSPVINGNEVTFYFEAENVNNVVVSGSMNDWSTDWTMTKDGNVFSYTTTISEGTYQYKYIVDGTWMTDPFNTETADDGAGNTNSTFTVTATTEGTSTEDASTEGASTENTTTEDSSTENENDTEASDAVKDDATPNGLSTGAIIAIVAVVTVVIVLGAFAGLTIYKKKKAN